jgi:acyl-CoA synthetase (AMP-forming)/AMP-acid ligase II
MLMHQLLLDGAERHPDKPAFRWVDRDRSLTYAETVTGMERMAGGLAHLGIRKGDRVTVFAHNGLDYLLAMLGAWRLGAISALVNVKLAADLDYYLADHEPSVVVYTHDMIEPLRAAAAKVASIRHLVCMDGPQDGAHSLPELLAAGLAPPADPWDETATAHLSYTSGTTGKPKGACLAHEPTVRACRCIAERLRIGPEDVSFGPTALSSSYQLVGNLLPPLSAGASIQVMGRWTQATGWEAVDAASATMLVGNPPLLEEILTESAARGRKPGRLRFVLSGGGPVPPTLKAAWSRELKVPLVESYGQSELGGFVALGRPELPEGEAEIAAVGRPLPDKEVRIFGPDDRPLPLGEVGEIVIRGGFMAGYWGKPDKTAETTRGGWLHTGDLGMMDRNGLVHMRSRRSELLLVDGVEWYPRDIEEALCRQPGVRQAALVGVPLASGGVRPVAFITGTPGGGPALKAAIAQNLPYDLTGLGIEAMDELPMTPTGKIAKAELARLAAEKGS